MASLRSFVICERLKGRPWPKGVESTRAHSPRRFGTMMSSRPFGASTRHSSRNSARVRARRDTPPQLAQQRARAFAPFEHVYQQETVCAFIRERQLGLVDENAQAMARAWPGDHAKLGRHERAAGAGIGAESTEVRRGEAEAEQAYALQIAPARPEPRPKQAAHHANEGRGVEVLQIDGIQMHGHPYNLWDQTQHTSHEGEVWSPGCRPRLPRGRIEEGNGGGKGGTRNNEKRG